MKEIPYGTNLVAKVDDDTYDFLVNYPKQYGRSWSQHNGYPAFCITTTTSRIPLTIHMHELVLGIKKGFMADHIDRDRSNAQLANLRHVTRAQSTWNRSKRKDNTSGYIGVYERRYGPRPFYYIIMINGRQVSKSFTTAERAARAYDTLAKEHRGKFAVLNFPEANTSI